MARSASAAALTSSRPQSAVANPAPSPQPHHLGRSPRRAGWGWDAGAAASDEGVLGGAPTAALGALGAAIITEVEAAAATTRSELLLIDNERLRLDTEAMLREGRGDPGSQGSSPSHVQEAAEETYADDRPGRGGCPASSEDGELDSQGARGARRREGGAQAAATPAQGASHLAGDGPPEPRQRFVSLGEHMVPIRARPGKGGARRRADQ